MNASPEEAEQVARLEDMVASCSWHDRGVAVRPIDRDPVQRTDPGI